MTTKITKLEDAENNPVRSKINEVIDVLNGNPEPPVRPDWSNDAPIPQGKWHSHNNSDKLLIDRNNMTHTKSSLTDEQKLEIAEDMPEGNPLDELQGE